MTNEQPQLNPEEQKKTDARIVSDAELIRRGAATDEQGVLQVSEEEKNRLTLENQEVVAANLREYIRKFKRPVLAAGEHQGWEDKQPGYCFFNGWGKFYFLDKDGNWNTVDTIDKRKIGSLRSPESRDKQAETMDKELKDSGFSEDRNGNFPHLEHQIEQKVLKQKEEEKRKQRAEFDI